jgi:hypothetical protein
MRRTVAWAVVPLGVLAIAVAAAGAPGRAGAATPPQGILPWPTTTSTTTTTTSTTSTTSTTTTTVAPTTSSTAATTSTTTSPPATTAPPAGGSSPYTAGFVPCSSGAAGPCTQTPRQLQLMYPAGAPAAAVELAWVADGRPAGAPSPASKTVVLPWSAGTGCGSQLRCWPWPQAETDGSFVLNGTYQVVPCGRDTGGACSSPAAAQKLGLAVPPGPPTQLRVSAAGPQVTLSWQPPAGAPPDLSGYGVVRDGHLVYLCGLGGIGPKGSVPCPASLTVTDRPADGHHVYTVSALRMGATPAGSGSVVSSAAAATPSAGVAVPGPVSPAGAGGPGTGFTQAPVIGAVGVIPDGAGSVGALSQVPAALGDLPGEGDPGGTGPVQNLQYPAGAPAGPASALTVRVGSPQSRPDIAPLALVALALLALSVAAHFLYLRSQLALVQARLAARRRADG